MLLLEILTFKHEDSMELFNRWKQVENLALPQGLKVINQWFDAGGGRIITLFDVETVKGYVAYNSQFVDLCHVDAFPVIEASEFKQFISKYMENLYNSKHSP
jgi:hypothetical protein